MFVVLAATDDDVGALIWDLVAAMLTVFVALPSLGSRSRQSRSPAASRIAKRYCTANGGTDGQQAR
ncbi:MAG TPA: hypothetical protein VM345_09600 [Acidimicrobiales bacterium]|nr:hypothetical protein [Acidimicrobiales bacterium]